VPDVISQILFGFLPFTFNCSRRSRRLSARAPNSHHSTHGLLLKGFENLESKASQPVTREETHIERGNVWCSKLLHQEVISFYFFIFWWSAEHWLCRGLHPTVDKRSPGGNAFTHWPLAALCGAPQLGRACALPVASCGCVVEIPTKTPFLHGQSSGSSSSSLRQ